MTVQVTFECPRCGKPCTSITELTGSKAPAVVGDISICLGCGAPLELCDNAPPRHLTYSELSRLPEHVRGPVTFAVMLIVTARPEIPHRLRWMP